MPLPVICPSCTTLYPALQLVKVLCAPLYSPPMTRSAAGVVAAVVPVSAVVTLVLPLVLFAVWSSVGVALTPDHSSPMVTLLKAALAVHGSTWPAVRLQLAHA